MRWFILALLSIIGLGFLVILAFPKYELVERLEVRPLGNIQTENLSQLWYSPGGELVGTGLNGSQLTVRVWPGAGGKIIRERSINLPGSTKYAVSADGSKVAWLAAAGAHMESLVSAGTGVDFGTKRGVPILGVALTTAGAPAVIYQDGELEIWDAAGARVIASKHLDLTEPVILLANQKYVSAYSSSSGETHVFDVGAGDKLSLIEYKKYPPEALALILSPQGRLGVGTRDTVEERGRSLAAPGPIRALTFFDRDRVLVAGDFPGIYVLGSDLGPHQASSSDPGPTVLATDGTKMAFGNSQSLAIASASIIQTRVYLGSLPRWLVISLLALIVPLAIYLGYKALNYLLKVLSKLPEHADPDKRKEDQGPIPAALVEACQNGDCVLWAGSGLAAQAGLPAWSAFLAEVVQWAANNKLAPPEVTSDALAELSQGQTGAAADRMAAAFRDSPQTLHVYLRQRFMVHLDLPEAYRLIKQIEFPGLITTAMDNLLDRTFPYSGGRIYTVADCVDLGMAASRREFFLLKPFGDLDRPDTLAFGPAECAAAIEDNPAASYFTQELFRTRVFLFLGASLDGIERDLGRILLEPPEGRKHYAFVPTTGEGWTAIADRLRERYGIEPLTYTPSSAEHPEVVEFLTKLIELIRERTSAREYYAAGE